MTIQHQPVVLCLTCMSKGYIEQKYHAIKESRQGIYVCLCGGGGHFYCTTEAVSLVKGAIFCCDIRGNYATKSTVAECVKRLCLGCVDELLAVFLEFPGVDGEAG